jgi:hypothetical protein
MTEAELKAEKVKLEKLIIARQTRLGFADNVRAIQARLDDINGLIALLPTS